MTYGSFYEITNPLTRVAKSHFVEWFSGKSYDSKRWTLISSGTAPTVAMQDSVDGGLLMTNTGAGGGGSICFNGIKQYTNPCSCIMVIKNTTANGLGYAGFSSTGVPSIGLNNSVAAIEMGGAVYMSLITTDGGDPGGWNRAATSIATANTDWWAAKIDVRPTSVSLSMNGILEAQSGVIPTTTMQPSVQGRNAGSNATTYIRYFEAWNN